MRILTVTLGYPKFPDDATAPFIGAIVRGLVAKGHRVDVVLPHNPDFRQADGNGVRFFPYRYSPYAPFAPWGFGRTFNARSAVRLGTAMFLPSIVVSLHHCLRRRLSVDHYDIVHAHWAVPNGWLASSVARQHRVPLVVTLHGSDVAMGERHRIVARLCARTFERADAVTATSDALRVRALALGARSDKTTTTYIGVDTERFRPRPVDPGLRHKLGADNGRFLIVAVGRLASVKGFEYLIAAASQLSDVTVAIVGDGELRRDLDRRARAAAANVRLIGSLSHDGVAEAMAAADVVVVPSVIDSSGRVDSTTSTVPEALACGRPLVATRVGGIPEIVADGRNGILVNEKDADALADAIRRLQRDETLRRELSRQAREFAVEHLGWRAAIDVFDETYDRVILARRSTSTSTRPPAPQQAGENATRAEG
jgi:phosphatidyl-myo-inositol dimannoside synthase